MDHYHLPLDQVTVAVIALHDRDNSLTRRLTLAGAIFGVGNIVLWS